MGRVFRIARMAAAILGASIALWMLRGDTDASDALTLACTVKHHDSFDFHGTQFFELRCGAQAATVSIDGDLPIAQWLRGHLTQPLTIDLAPRVVQKLER